MGAYGFDQEEEEEDDLNPPPTQPPLDPVDLYTSRFTGKLAVTLAAGVVGTGMGLALSASAFHKPSSFALGGLGVGLLLSLLRNDFGDLFR